MPNEKIVGHHGTSKRIADQVLSQGFLTSKNSYDWLGDGVYFWQNAPLRALNWATKTFGADGVAIEADIEVRAGPGCLNRISASISGASAGVRLPGGLAAG